jgi:hypothetical protein
MFLWTGKMAVHLQPSAKLLNIFISSQQNTSVGTQDGLKQRWVIKAKVFNVNI